MRPSLASVAVGILTVSMTGLGGCKSTPAATDPTPPVGHPCPEQALPPELSSTWSEAIRTETPVPLTLALPLPANVDIVVTQGNHGALSHYDRLAFAWDFDVALGTEALAAAPGIVVWVEDDHSEYGPDESFRELANYVVVDHGAGLFTAYVHLAPGGARVMAGDVVAAGDVLGVTGLSGQMTGPHLHFHVENVWSETVPARFVDDRLGGCGLLPTEGASVRAGQATRALLIGRDEPSEVPEDTFAEDQVTEVQGLPARVLEAGQRFAISGRTTLAGATEVVLLFIPPEGGNALAVRRWPVDGDGSWSGVLDLRDIAPRAYGLALVAGTGAPVSVPRTVLATVVE